MDDEHSIFHLSLRNGNKRVLESLFRPSELLETGLIELNSGRPYAAKGRAAAKIPKVRNL